MADKITIGADPELALLNPLTGKYADAHSIFRPDGSPTSASFGYDANPSTVELRPKFSTDPLEVVDNIYKILEDAKKEFPQVFRLDIKPSDSTISVGGHIHLGHKKYVNDDYLRTRATNLLDYLLAIPVSFLEIPEHRYNRLRNRGYGKLGDARQQEWGLEYRTLPSWIATRELAESVLSIGHLIGSQALNNQEFDVKNTPLNKINHNHLREVFNNCYQSVLFPIIPLIKKEVEKIDGADKYKKQIDYLFKSVEAGTPILSTEIKNGWRIKFLRLSDLKLNNLKDLVLKVGQALTLQSNNNQTIFTWGNDYRGQTIANGAGSAIEGIVGADILSLMSQKTKIKIVGLHKKHGDVIELPLANSWDSQKHLTELVSELCIKMGYNPKLITVISSKERLGLSRAIREREDYLAEALACLVWLFIHREAYKSTTQTKTGRTIRLPFGKNNAIQPLVLTIKDQKRVSPPTVSDFLDDEGDGVDINKVRNYCISDLFPRLVEQIDTGHRLRLPESIRNMIMDLYYSSNCVAPCTGDESEPEELCNKHLFGFIYNGSFT